MQTTEEKPASESETGGIVGDIRRLKVNSAATVAELREFLASHSHTEFVVCDDDLDNVLGTVRAAELLPAILRGGAIKLRPLIREPLFVPDSMPVFKLLDAFQSVLSRATVNRSPNSTS